MIDHILTNSTEISSKVDNWSVHEVVDDGGTTYYVDESGNRWCKFHIETDFHGGGQPILIKLPEPTQKNLIELALSSSNDEDIATFAALLYYNERDRKQEFRELLITEIESHISSKQFNWTEKNKSKIKTIIYESSLYDDTNLRPIDGKSIQEISEDHSFYKSISVRAKQILATANST